MTNAPASSSCCRIRSPPEPPVSRSASSPLTRGRIEVRSSSCRASFRLPLEDLGHQVLGDRALAAAELGREAFRVGVPGQRQRGQPQSRRPALGPAVQHVQRGVGQRHPGRIQHRPRLGPAEPQIIGADLGELPGQAQPVQAQPEVTAGNQDEPQGGRGAHDQQLQLAQRLGRAQLVQVVDHQPDLLFQRGEVLQQPLDRRPAIQVGRGRQPAHQRGPGSRVAQRADHGDP